MLGQFLHNRARRASACYWSVGLGSLIGTTILAAGGSDQTMFFWSGLTTIAVHSYFVITPALMVSQTGKVRQRRLLLGIAAAAPLAFSRALVTGHIERKVARAAVDRDWLGVTDDLTFASKQRIGLSDKVISSAAHEAEKATPSQDVLRFFEALLTHRSFNLHYESDAPGPLPDNLNIPICPPNPTVAMLFMLETKRGVFTGKKIVTQQKDQDGLTRLNGWVTCLFDIDNRNIETASNPHYVALAVVRYRGGLANFSGLVFGNCYFQLPYSDEKAFSAQVAFAKAVLASNPSSFTNRA